MILFVVEGERRETGILKSLSGVFWRKDECMVVAYGCNIYALYNEMKALGDDGMDADIVQLLRARYEGRPHNPFINVLRSDDFSEIFLIFDYDFHDMKMKPSFFNERLAEMLEYFCEETDKGKLYINYPMIEAIAYTKKLPDSEFSGYSVTREECRHFKELTHDFSFYPNYDFICRGEVEQRKSVWALLIRQNVSKANAMCTGDEGWPVVKSSIAQSNILSSQAEKYESLPGCRVAVLSSLPLLLYDWMGQGYV